MEVEQGMRLGAGVGCVPLLPVSVYGLMQISIWAVRSLMKYELMLPGSSCQVPLHVCFVCHWRLLVKQWSLQGIRGSLFRERLRVSL